MLTAIEKAKKNAGDATITFVKSGMTVGLGSGSTVYWMIKKLAAHVETGLDIAGIPSSEQTAQWARDFGLPLTDFSEVRELDITLDGADEIDPHFNLIKGGGGALVREKMLAVSADVYVIIADQSKMVDELGSFWLPVEILPFGWQVTASNIKQLGGEPILRQDGGRVFVSDNGNYIVDCNFGSIPNPQLLHTNLKQLTGVVETGLFPGMADAVIIGSADDVEIKSTRYRNE